MFHHAKNFNGNISKWDTSRVTNMESTFNQAVAFDGDISLWDVSSVTNMKEM
jgi:surface protein